MIDTSLAKYYAAKARTANFPHVEVTKEEMAAKLIARGDTPERANMISNMCEVMGSHIEIGQEMVAIKKEKSNE